MNKLMEIIAPVAKKEYIELFLDAGADTVYAGLKNRTWHYNTVEFSWEELIALSVIVHNRQKKIYVAINRNLSTEDVDEVLHYAHLFENGTFDAIILSDWGCIDALRRNYGNIEIHLSANALCIDYSAFELARRLKIQRIIFTPSFRHDEIKKIMKQYPDSEWEAIILGSRCYNEVGFCKCYVENDSKIYKEICRKQYYLYKNNERIMTDPQVWGFPLLKETSVFPFYNLGINCWKIEGRDRSPGYLARGIRDLKKIKDSLLVGELN